MGQPKKAVVEVVSIISLVFLGNYTHFLKGPSYTCLNQPFLYTFSSCLQDNPDIVSCQADDLSHIPFMQASSSRLFPENMYNSFSKQVYYTSPSFRLHSPLPNRVLFLLQNSYLYISPTHLLVKQNHIALFHFPQ